MVAERAADVPGAGAFPYQAHEMEVVLLADIISADRPAPLGDRKPDVERALRVPGTADKLGRAPHMLDRQRPPAGGAAAKIEFFCRPVPDVIPDYLLVCLKLVECLMQHAARFFNHVIGRTPALFYLLHMRLD